MKYLTPSHRPILFFLFLFIILSAYQNCSQQGFDAKNENTEDMGVNQEEWSASANLRFVAPNNRGDLEKVAKSLLEDGHKILSLTPEGELVVESAKDNSGQSVLETSRGLTNMDDKGYSYRSVLMSSNRVNKSRSEVTKRINQYPFGWKVAEKKFAQKPTSINSYREAIVNPQVNSLYQERLNIYNLSASVLSKPTESFLPAVDNSISKYFPRIGDQGMQGSCTAWSIGYYITSYNHAKLFNRDIKNSFLNEACSPTFLYPLTNAGVDFGSELNIVFDATTKFGCAPLRMIPYNVNKSSVWPSEILFRKAYRNESFVRWTADSVLNNPYDFKSKVGFSDSELNAIKVGLGNGELFGMGILVDSNLQTLNNYTSDVISTFAEERILGGHAVTIVGYDDNKTYVVRNADGTTTEGKGAFLIANSWGQDWGITNTLVNAYGEANGEMGYFWVSYDLMKNRIFNEGEVFYAKAKDDGALNATSSGSAPGSVQPTPTSSKLYISILTRAGRQHAFNYRVDGTRSSNQTPMEISYNFMELFKNYPNFIIAKYMNLTSSRRAVDFDISDLDTSKPLTVEVKEGFAGLLALPEIESISFYNSDSVTPISTIVISEPRIYKVTIDYRSLSASEKIPFADNSDTPPPSPTLRDFSLTWNWGGCTSLSSCSLNFNLEKATSDYYPKLQNSYLFVCYELKDKQQSFCLKNNEWKDLTTITNDPSLEFLKPESTYYKTPGLSCPVNARWKGCVRPPRNVFNATNLTAINSTGTLYAGYGVGDTPSAAFSDFKNRRTYGKFQWPQPLNFNPQQTIYDNIRDSNILSVK